MKKLKQYAVLSSKQLRGYRQKDVVSNVWNVEAKNLEFIGKGKNNLILFFLFYIGWQIILGLITIRRSVLFSRKNNQEGWMESEGYLEPSRTSVWSFFVKIVNG